MTRPPAPEPEAAAPTKPADATPAPPKLQRRPLLVVAAVVFIAVGALLTAWVVTAVGDTHAVVAVRNDIERGDQITREDLIEAQINADPALHTIPAEQIDTVVGKHTAIDLPAGGLVSPDHLNAEPVPADGETVVGVALTPAQMPGVPMHPGTRVRVVGTPRTQDDPPDQNPDTIEATVVGVREVPESGQSVVDVAVPHSQAGLLAGIVATGRVALIVDGVS